MLTPERADPRDVLMKRSPDSDHRLCRSDTSYMYRVTRWQSAPYKRFSRPRLGRLSQNGTRKYRIRVVSLHQVLSSHERLRRAGLRNERHVPASVAFLELFLRDRLLSRDDGLDEMHSAIRGGTLQHRDHVPAFDLRQPGEGCRCADDGGEGTVRVPLAQLGGEAPYARDEAGILGRAQHA